MTDESRNTVYAGISISFLGSQIRVRVSAPASPDENPVSMCRRNTGGNEEVMVHHLSAAADSRLTLQ